MKQIPLTNNKDLFALVDDEDFDKVSKYSWRYRANIDKTTGNHRNGYAYNSVKGFMHRFVLNCPPSTKKGPRIEIDHINHDGLDNQKGNLRPTSRSQNQHNRRPNFNKVLPTGVTLNVKKQIFESKIYINNKYYYLGGYKSSTDAASVYRKVKKDYHEKNQLPPKSKELKEWIEKKKSDSTLAVNFYTQSHII